MIEALARKQGDADRRSAGQRRADALTEIAEQAGSRGGTRLIRASQSSASIRARVAGPVQAAVAQAHSAGIPDVPGRAAATVSAKLTGRCSGQKRPALLLTRAATLRLLVWVTVAPITSTVRGITSEIPVGARKDT